MRQKKEIPRICVGVDLHKLQFTVHAVDEETGEVVLTGVFKTDNQVTKISVIIFTPYKPRKNVQLSLQ